MIPVTKQQAAYLRAMLPGVHIITLSRFKSKARRKHRLAEEPSAVKQLLANYEAAQSNKSESE